MPLTMLKLFSLCLLLVGTSASADLEMRLRVLEHTAANPAENQLTNGSFDFDSLGWEVRGQPKAQVEVVDDSLGETGPALRLAPDGSGSPRVTLVSNPMPVTAGRSYRIEALWRMEEGYLSTFTGVPPRQQAEIYFPGLDAPGIYLEWLAEDGRALEDPRLWCPLWSSAPVWTKLGATTMAPEDAHSARVVIHLVGDGETVWLDELVFAPVEATEGTSDFRALETSVTSGEVLGTNLRTEVEDLGNAWSVTATVENSMPSPRALELVFELALTGTDWIWWDDLHRHRRAEGPQPLHNAVSAIVGGWLPVSLYPVAAVTSEAAEGVAALLPPDHPQLALMQFIPEAEILQIRFYTAFREESGGPPATFRFLLRDLAPGSGMREGVAFLQEQFPTHFSSSLPLYSFQDRAQGSFLTEERAREILELDEENIYAAQYTLSEFAFSVAPSSESRPTLGDALAHVDEMLGSERPVELAYAEAFSRSAVMRLSGFPALKFVGEPAWNQGNWEAGWPANFHPDITGGIGDWTIQWRVDPAFSASAAVGAVLNGVQIDNFLSVPALDHRTEILSSFPNQLVFDPNNLQPAYPIAFGMDAFLHHLRSHVDQTWGTDRGISVNFWGLANPNFLLGKVDAFGNEGHTNSGYGRNWNPEILDYRRVMAGSRPMFFANQTSGLGEEEARRFCSLALLFGIRPGFGPNASGWDLAAERLIEETSNLVASYWHLLWHPLPRAKAEGYRVERFGADLRQGVVFAVFHPTGNSEGGSLIVDETLSHVPEGFRLEARELLSGNLVSVDQGEAGMELPMGPFQSEETKVFRLQVYPADVIFNDRFQSN